MYEMHALSPKIIAWVFDEAMNELNAYLCEVDFREMYGSEWPAMARETAADCRAVAETATDAAKRQAWLSLAQDYEETIESVAAI
jgi:hypothetical protein